MATICPFGLIDTSMKLAFVFSSSVLWSSPVNMRLHWHYLYLEAQLVDELLQNFA